MEYTEYSKEELLEAKRRIDSTLQTLESKENPQRYKSQITLAKRRVKAFEIAVSLLEKDLLR